MIAFQVKFELREVSLRILQHDRPVKYNCTIGSYRSRATPAVDNGKALF